MTKYIVVVGGVISGVGKGVSTASLGKILQQYGYGVTAIKIDPYINYDAGTLRPTEHGEVWVTDDGGEIDQDLGNYERFLGLDIPRANNITTGQIYKEVIDRERRGEFLGQTVQFIPHIPDEIKRRVRQAGTGNDFVLIEIGGTIGDYENIPFLFAMKSLERELPPRSVGYILVTYLPVPGHIDEMKTKPTQQAIRQLSESGIIPDFIICRANQPLDLVRKKKIETYANIRTDHVISAPDLKSIYDIPQTLEKDNLGRKILRHFGLTARKKPSWRRWEELAAMTQKAKPVVKVAMVGKYTASGSFGMTDAYVSINESLQHAAAHAGTKVAITWLDAQRLEKTGRTEEELSEFDGILIPGGFGAGGVEGKIKAITWAREKKVPFLGICYGMQLAVVEYARNVCGLTGSHTTEVAPRAKHPVIDILPAQKKILQQNQYGGTMRLGSYAAILDPKSGVYQLYRQQGRLKEDKERIELLLKKPDELFRLGIAYGSQHIILERHRHRYEVSPRYAAELEKKGMVFSGWHHRTDGAKLMEFLELPTHPFFIASQAHPEFKSRLESPAPLFLGFVTAMVKRFRK